MEVFSDQLNRKSSVGFRTKFWIARSFSPVLPLCVLPPLPLLSVTTCYGEAGEMPTSGEQKPLIETWSFLFAR